MGIDKDIKDIRIVAETRGKAAADKSGSTTSPTEKPKGGREFEIDFAKFLAILFMVLVHCFDYSTLGLEGSTPARGLIEFLGSPLAAPVFMFCMGIGMVYSSHSDPSSMAKRGVKLIAIGYLLNLYRSLIPAAMYLSGMQGWEQTRPLFVAMIFCVDILPFAGLAFLFFSLVKKTGMRMQWCAIIVLALLLLSQAVPEIGDDSFIPKYLVGLFAYQNDFTSFPLMQWLPFPLAGIFFGEKLKGAKNKDELYFSAMTIGIIALVGASVIGILSGREIRDFYTTTYLDMDFIQVAWTLGVVLLWLGVLHLVSKAFLTEVPGGKPSKASPGTGMRIREFATFCSRGITKLYIWHWVILVPVILLTHALMPVDTLAKLVGEFLFVFALSCLAVWKLSSRDPKAAKKR